MIDPFDPNYLKESRSGLRELFEVTEHKDLQSMMRLRLVKLLCAYNDQEPEDFDLISNSELMAGMAQAYEALSGPEMEEDRKDHRLPPCFMANSLWKSLPEHQQRTMLATYRFPKGFRSTSSRTLALWHRQVGFFFSLM